MVSLLRFRQLDERLVPDGGGTNDNAVCPETSGNSAVRTSKTHQVHPTGSINLGAVCSSEENEFSNKYSVPDEVSSPVSDISSPEVFSGSPGNIWKRKRDANEKRVVNQTRSDIPSPTLTPRSSGAPSHSPNGLLQAANYVMEVGRSVSTPRFPTQVGNQRRDQLGQPLLVTSSQSSLPAGSANDGATPDDGDLGEGTLDLSLSGSLPRHPPRMTAVSLSSDGPNDLMRDRLSSTRSNGSVRSSIRGSVISFTKISYIVEQKKFPWSKGVKKTVLNGVSGIMKPGLNAIMGPTGSGKSSLLDVLAGRKDPRYLRGDVLVDGTAQPHNFKCISGYVVQDDIIMGTLTVRENLRFSAALRLSAKWSNADRKQKVEEIIEDLGLTKVADSKIGTELIRGVSGGERKRTNIGMELITDPPVLFLDEPTTGLDAFTAGSVIKTLRNLSLRGRTIIFSIHQPKYSIYKLFDTLTLVLNGNIVYHGVADNAPINYFRNLGFVCEAHNSPPDFFMDIMHGEIPADGEGALESADNTSLSAIEAVIVEPETIAIHDRLINSWIDSEECKIVHDEADRLYQNSLIAKSGDYTVKKPSKVNYPTSFYNQLIYVSWRTGLNLFRNPQSSVIQLAVYLFFGLSIGTVYLNLDDSTESGIQNREGLFFFLVLQMTFVNLSAIEVFIKERVAFIHENSSGFYRVSVYFLAKVFCDMLPIKAMPVVLFMPIVYWMAGLRPDAGAFFFYELNLVLTTMAACAVAFFVSASVSVFGIANIIISIMYVFMMVFGGFLINIKTLGKWLSWCRYLSLFRYSISALSINEMKNIVFCPRLNITANVTRSCKPGTVYLQEQDIPYKTGWDLWLNELGMLLITLFFCFLCYVQLRRINKYK